MSINIPPKIRSYISDKSYTVNNIGMSGGTVLSFDNMVLKIEKQNPETEETIKIMNWLEGRLPAPKVICHEVCEEQSYLLMSRIEGKMSCDEYYLKRPHELITLLANGLKMLWSTDISDCPKVQSLEHELAAARYNVENGLVDMERTEPETFGKNEFESPAALLEWLEANKPPCEPVLSHGDFCLPNIFLKDGKVSGFIDLGGMGIADKWRDISLCYRSLKHNFDGTFSGKIYKDFDPDMLFEALGIVPDRERLRYWILLDELF